MFSHRSIFTLLWIPFSFVCTLHRHLPRHKVYIDSHTSLKCFIFMNIEHDRTKNVNNILNKMSLYCILLSFMEALRNKMNILLIGDLLSCFSFSQIKNMINKNWIPLWCTNTWSISHNLMLLIYWISIQLCDNILGLFWLDFDSCRPFFVCP